MTSMIMFAPNLSIGFKWNIGNGYAAPKTCIKSMSEAKKLFRFSEKVLTVPIKLRNKL